MKHLLKIALGLIVCMAAMTACNDDDDNGITGLIVDKEDITIGAEGGADAIVVSSDGEWYASASEPWVTLSPANGMGKGTECTVAIDSTMSNEVRKAEIRISLKGQAPKTVTVHQTGYGKMISIEEADIEIESSAAADKRYFEAVVTTNVPFKIEAEYAEIENIDWVIMPEDATIDLDRGYRPRTAKIRFEWKMNPDFTERNVKINFVPTKEEDVLEAPAVLAVKQKGAPKIEDNRAGDSLTLLTIKERLLASSGWDPSENMRNWDNLELWERTDKDLPSDDAIGRVRSVEFAIFETEESIPQEIRYLKYVEKLSFYSNTNTMFKSIKLGTEICTLKYLKDLTVGAYGLVLPLPDEFIELGKTLERLDLSSNNFTDVPAILTPENFPKLKSLNIGANRRWAISNLKDSKNPQYAEEGIGLHFNTEENQALKRLFLWENLEELRLSYNYMEGSVPDFTIGADGVRAYTAEDLTAYGDTLDWLVKKPEGQQIPRILPKIKKFSINLNFFTGSLPNWILYHPHLIEWVPEVLIFNQMENGFDSSGKVVKFDNAPKNFDYYYANYPKYREKYELKDVVTE